MSTSTTNGKQLMEPKGFTGRREEAQLWLFKVQAYFQANKTLYVDDESKIYFILGLCEKTPVVQKWAESKYMALAHHQGLYDTILAVFMASTATPTPPPTPLELTYANFIREFKMGSNKLHD